MTHERRLEGEELAESARGQLGPNPVDHAKWVIKSVIDNLDGLVEDDMWDEGFSTEEIHTALDRATRLLRSLL